MRLKAFLLVWVSGALTLHSASAQSIGGSNSHPVPPEVVLRPEPVPYDLEGSGGSASKQTKPFSKEPDLGQGPAFRWVLHFGKDTNNAIPMLWDRANGKLYFDLNRNLDLTDDPAGVFVSPHKGHFTQYFTNVTLPLKTAMGLHPAILQLKLSSDRQSSWSQVQVTPRSVWQAKVTTGDEEWQVAVVDSLLGPASPTPGKFLLLRPWALRTNRVSLDYPASGIVPFPDRLFWLGQAFHLERRIETGGETPVCRLALTPEHPPLTELKLSGEFLCYALLRATNGYTVVLRDAPGTVKVPQGVYTVSAVWLKRGATEASRAGYPPLVVNATTATNLVLGGPLTNWVTAERNGRRLQIGRELKGADGAVYGLAQEDRAKPPEFTVYYGGKKVLAGKFQYG
jgi:hypothetical protein